MKGTLRYIRVATKARDTWAGFLYFHSWPTGGQELVFASHDVAKQFADVESLTYVKD